MSMLKSKLKNARKAKAYSQAYMASMLHMDTASYNRRENGKSPIQNSEWKKLAEILGVSLSDIFEEPHVAFASIAYPDENNGNTNVEHYRCAALRAIVENQLQYIRMLEEEVLHLRKSYGKVG